jgi:hypothetical protein
MKLRSLKDMESTSLINETPDEEIREKKRDKTFDLEDVHKSLTPRAKEQIEQAGSALIEKVTTKCGNEIRKIMRCHTIKQADNFLGKMNVVSKQEVAVEKAKVRAVKKERKPKVWKQGA